MQEEKRSVTVGFFFSLGHSTVVFIMTLLVAAGSAAITNNLFNHGSALKAVGGLIGTSVSALFLFAIAIMNLAILVEIIRTFRKVTRGDAYDADAIEEYLNKRGFFARIFRGIFKTVDMSWKMYPIGFLFGLGFDTATEIGLLAVAGTAATHLPFYVVLLLPLLFTAGMSLADTTDGVMMLGAYGWAFVKPVRKLFYNMSITLVSVLVAVLVGSVETLGIIQSQTNTGGPFWDFIGKISGGDAFGYIGFGIIGIFLLAWGLSSLIYRVNRYDDLEAKMAPPLTLSDAAE